MAFLLVDAEALDAAVSRLMVHGTNSGDATDDDETQSPSQSSATVSSTDSSADHQRQRRPTPRRTPRKRGKPTYYIRKNEIGELQDEVKRLRDELAQLKTRPRDSSHALEGAQALMGVYASGIARNKLTFAGLQSLLSAVTQSGSTNSGLIPLKIPIHLPVDLVQRDQILESMREPKLYAATSFVAERTRCLDLRVSHRHSEMLDLPNGDSMACRFDVTPFDCGHSLRQVYEELLCWMKTGEIAITLKSDALAVRQGNEVGEASYGQSRFLITVFDDIKVESNSVFFRNCVDGTLEKPGYAVYTIDCVDQDDLYPYHSDMYGRREMVATFMVVEIPTATGGRAVSMIRWSHSKFSGPLNNALPVELSAVRDEVDSVCCEIPKVIKERLETRAPTAV